MCSFRGPISHICTDEVEIWSRWVGLLIVGAKWNKSRPLSNLNTVIRSAAILPQGLTRNSNVKLMQSTLECRKIFRPTAAVPTKKLSVEVALPTLATVLADRKITQLLLPPPRRLCNRRCLSVCLYVCLSVYLLTTLRKSFQTDLYEIFSEGSQWASEQMIKFWWRSGSRIWIRMITDPNTDPDPDP